ncbi:hypothetical protein [Natrarchaeobaculum sulfurireducens]|nr:hypothetical protein [Natrarchaeobaculum sulfurireducens]
MSDDNRISRRRSLKGIAATGTFIAGAGIGANSVSAGKKDKADEKKETDREKTPKEKEHAKGKKEDPDGVADVVGVDKLDFQQCHSVAILFDQEYVEAVASDDGIVKGLRIRLYNARHDRVENYDRTVTIGDLRSSTLHGEDDVGDVFAYTFNVYQFFDRPIGAGDSIVAVTMDGTTFQNPNACAEPYQRTFEGEGVFDLDDISLQAVCVDSERGLARYRVRNGNHTQIEAVYDVEDTDESGTIAVEPYSATYFEVAAPEGEATVSIAADGETLDERESAIETECVPRDSIALNAECYDPVEGAARFYVHNGTDRDLTFVIYVAETGATGRITVEDSLASAETFWVPAPDGEASVSLYYEGEVVGADVSDPDDTC